MDTLAIFALQFILSLVVFGLLAKWYVLPRLAQYSTRQALIPLLIPHALRHLGLVFLVPGLVVQPLASSFANAAAYGDLVSGLLALLAMVALRARWGLALVLVWMFNIVGTVDLLNALRQAEVVPNLGTTWFIPTFVVPILLVTHALIFAQLFKARRYTLSDPKK